MTMLGTSRHDGRRGVGIGRRRGGGAWAVRVGAHLHQQPGPVAAVNPGRHHSGQDNSAESYGRHSPTNAGGLTVAALIERVARAGQAVRLAWRGREAAGVADWSDEFPTAVLPVVRDTNRHHAEPDGSPGEDEGTEPTTATREAQQWLRASGFLWWQQWLAERLGPTGKAHFCLT
jgi:hypothetical protein